MSKVLKRLLLNDHPLFLMNVALLERATGGAGIDARLVGDITSKSHQVLKSLGLDSSDTTEQELYLALQAKYRQNPDALKRQLSGAEYSLVNYGLKPVSLNFRDVEENADQRFGYEDSVAGHAQRQLRAELVRRYAEHERTHDDMVFGLAREVGVLIEGENFSAMPEPKQFTKQHEVVRDAALREESQSEGRGFSSPEDSDRSVVLLHAASYHRPIGTRQVKTTVKNKENQTMQDTPRILAVGDINTNAFIKLTDDHVGLETDQEGYQRISLELGAKLPYDSVEVIKVNECSPNAAVSLARLGLDSHLMAWVGGDEVGKEMIEYLQAENVKTDSMVVEEDQKSNYHFVLRYGADRTKLQRFEDFSYQWQAPAERPDWLYLGVLGEDTWELHQAMLGYLEDNPEIKLVFQPGMYHLMWGAEKLADFYRRAEIVIMNREEAAQVTGKSREDIKELLDGLHQLGVTVAVVTDGPAGAYASDGSKQLFMPNFPDPKEPFERTGAGDAFASTIVAALALGEPLEVALTWAPINSAYVVQQMGAQAGLLTRQALLDHLADAPDWYHTKPLDEYLAEQV